MKSLNIPFHNDKQKSYIHELAYSFQKSKVLFTAIELDIFTLLGDGFKTSKEIATEIGADERSTNRLMNALVTLELLEKKAMKFQNTDYSKRYLSRSSVDFLGDMTHVMHLWDKWNKLTEAVITGQPVDYKDINEKEDHWVEALVSSTHWTASKEAKDVIEFVEARGVKRFLDLGCGSGLYAMEFLKKHPSIEAVCFDVPKVIPHTKKHIKREGFEGKIEILEGDFMADNIGEGYDMIFVSNVVHEYSIWDNIKLLQKAYHALNPNGTIVLHDYIIDDNRTKPCTSVMMSLNMLVNTKAGDTYTETDIWVMLKESWFSDITKINTQHDTSIITGKKLPL